MDKKTKTIVRTAVFIAVLIALQFATKAAGQYVTGSCVNMVLAVSAMVEGLVSGLVVAAVSPFLAFLLGIGPALIQVVPGIAVGNIVFVIVIWLITRRESDKELIRSYISVVIAAVLKFAALYAVIVMLIIPMLSLPEKQAATMTLMFSWPQLVTALIGGIVAATISPLIKKAVKKNIK